MILIAAVDEHWGLGKNGQLLARIPQDLKHFKAKTIGNIILMGRKTLESFPSSKPLPDRMNIVITRNQNYQAQDAIVCHSIEEAIAIAKNHPEKQLFTAGGGSIYKQCLPYCHTAYITKIHSTFAADTFLENLDADKNWSIIETSEPQSENGFDFTYVTYTSSKVNIPN